MAAGRTLCRGSDQLVKLKLISGSSAASTTGLLCFSLAALA